MIYVVRCTIWYHLYNLKNVKNTHGGVLILVKLHAKACNFTKINTSTWVFARFLNCTNSTKSRNAPHNSIANFLIHESKYSLITAAVVWRCSVEKVLLEISRNSQENTCARISFLTKLQARPAALSKKRLWHKNFYRTTPVAASVNN